MLKAKIKANGEWSEFRSYNHQQFEAETEGGIRLVLFVSRIHLIDDADRQRYAEELAGHVARKSRYPKWLSQLGAWIRGVRSIET